MRLVPTWPTGNPPGGGLGCSRDNERVDIEHRSGTVGHVPWGERACPSVVGKVRFLWSEPCIPPRRIDCRDVEAGGAQSTRCAREIVVQGLGLRIQGSESGVHGV